MNVQLDIMNATTSVSILMDLTAVGVMLGITS